MPTWPSGQDIPVLLELLVSRQHGGRRVVPPLRGRPGLRFRDSESVTKINLEYHGSLVDLEEYLAILQVTSCGLRLTEPPGVEVNRRVRAGPGLVPPADPPANGQYANVTPESESDDVTAWLHLNLAGGLSNSSSGAS